VGDEPRTKFWHDLWCGNTVLKEAFHVFYLVLLVLRMPLLQRIWSFWVVPISGTCAFLEKRMIGKWMLCFIFPGVALLRTYVQRRKRGQEANEHIAKDLARVQGEDISGS
jgi:hypothetical protein